MTQPCRASSFQLCLANLTLLDSNLFSLYKSFSLSRSFSGVAPSIITEQSSSPTVIRTTTEEFVSIKTFSLDNLLYLPRGTILHPLTSLLLSLGLILSGKEPSPIRWGSGLASTQWLGLSSSRMRLAAGCVIAAWVLSINRVLSRRAPNPSRKSRTDIKRKVVAITVAAAGVGAALEQKLDAAGATVIVLDVSALSYTPGRRTPYVKCDVSDPASIREAAAKISSRHGVPTAMVANAGLVRGHALLDASDDDLRLTLDVNLLGLLWSIRAFLPDMIAAGRGHVLATLSATAFVTVPSMADYSASKAAAASLIEGLRTELKHHHGNPGVAINAVYPGTISTKMFKDLDSPNLFAMPMLSPDAAQRIFDILVSGKSENAYLPSASTAHAWLRVLPHWMFVGMQDAGAHAAEKLGKKK